MTKVPAITLRTLALLPFIAAASLSSAQESRLPRHDLVVTLDPVAKRLSVRDTLRLSPGAPPEFVLNGRLAITRSEPALETVPTGDVSFFGINAAEGASPGLALKRDRAKTPPAGGVIQVDSSGAFDYGLSAQKEEYTRGFRGTVGMVAPEGVYLAGSSFWYPQVESRLLEFRMEVRAPATGHLGGEKMAFAGHTLVAVARHPGNPALAVGLISVDPAAAFDGVGRKLPHYGKHSYLVIGVINLDTVGRLGAPTLSALGTGTATGWQHIFRGASFVTGVDSRSVPESIQSSDQMSFVVKGVPAVQIFTSATGDYHRASDTADKIDGAGLVKVATWVKEGAQYLAERAEPLTNTIPKAAGASGSAEPAPVSAAPPPGPPPTRRVSFGTVTDFAFNGPGVRVSGLLAGSPAEKAGLREGDVLTDIAGKPVANLQAFSDILRTLQPGQEIAVRFTRAAEPQTLRLQLAER